MIKVRKRDGRLVDWDDRRISEAIRKAGLDRATLRDQIAALVRGTAFEHGRNNRWEVGIEHIQDMVEQSLMANGFTKVAKSYILFREQRSKVREVVPNDRALPDYIQVGKYARHREEDQRRETWEESAIRLMEMHVTKHPQWASNIRELFQEYVIPQRVMPSMRSVQFGGRAIFVNNARLYNCCFTLIDRPRVFAELFFLLLSGCGAGFSVKRRHVSQLPEVVEPDIGKVVHITLADSIEGWAEAIEYLVSSFMDPKSVVYRRWVEFSYENIRSQGTVLRTSGGRAPGHVPLRRVIERLRTILSKAVGRKLRSLECHDICCHIADAVLAGGVRRSSLISIFDPDDPDMMTAKSDPDWFTKTPWRANANNSAGILEEDATPELFREIFRNTRRFGEPGALFQKDPDYGTNPCGEIGLFPRIQIDSKWETGFAFCNLTEINGRLVKGEGDFWSCAHSAAMLGTLQATYTRFPFLRRASELIAERDALLGVGITGIMEKEILRNGRVLATGAAHAIAANTLWAERLGINRAKRVTTVKPSGTASLHLGCVSSGIHPHHSRRYIRRIIANPIEPHFKYLRSINPQACVQKPSGDWVVEFPIQAPPGAICKEDIAAVDFMETVRNLYQWWIKPGTMENDPDSPGLTHNVSSTIHVREHEWAHVANLFWEMRGEVQAMSFLPFDDTIYPFAPLEAVKTEEQEFHWMRLAREWKPIDWTKFRETDDQTNLTDAPACEGPSCEVPRHGQD